MVVIKPTKEQVQKFIQIRNSGKFNMVMDAVAAATEANLPNDIYLEILKNFSSLVSEYELCLNEDKMKTFNDLVFVQHKNFDSPAVQIATLKFDNGYEVLVLFGDEFYSNGIDNYELGIVDKTGFLNGDLFVELGYEHPGDDVIGYVTPEFITEVMEKLQKLS